MPNASTSPPPPGSPPTWSRWMTNLNYACCVDPCEASGCGPGRRQKADLKRDERERGREAARREKAFREAGEAGRKEAAHRRPAGEHRRAGEPCHAEELALAGEPPLAEPPPNQAMRRPLGPPPPDFAPAHGHQALPPIPELSSLDPASAQGHQASQPIPERSSLDPASAQASQPPPEQPSRGRASAPGRQASQPIPERSFLDRASAQGRQASQPIPERPSRASAQGHQALQPPPERPPHDRASAQGHQAMQPSRLGRASASGQIDGAPALALGAQAPASAARVPASGVRGSASGVRASASGAKAGPSSAQSSEIQQGSPRSSPRLRSNQSRGRGIPPHTPTNMELAIFERVSGQLHEDVPSQSPRTGRPPKVDANLRNAAPRRPADPNAPERSPARNGEHTRGPRLKIENPFSSGGSEDSLSPPRDLPAGSSGRTLYNACFRP
jgi:hypothetical protein